MRFWNNVLELLRRQDRSIRSLSRAVGVSPTALTNYGKGASPSLDVAVKIAHELNVSLDWLVSGSVSDPPRHICPSPEEHALLRELTDELGLRDALLLARLSSTAVALAIADLLEIRRPDPVSYDEICRSVEATSTETIDASLLFLLRQGTIDEFSDEEGKSYGLRGPVGSFKLRDTPDHTMNMARAVRLLFSRVLPALEKESSSGHLLTYTGNIPDKQATIMVEEFTDYLRARSRELLSEDGNDRVTLVFGVARDGG